MNHPDETPSRTGTFPSEAADAMEQDKQTRGEYAAESEPTGIRSEKVL